MPKADRGPALTVFAVLFAVLAVSNFLKPFQLTSDTGFVLFGKRLSGTPNALAGSLFGIYLLAYALGIWRMRRYALAMGDIYAGYVILNLILFNVRNTTPPGVAYLVFGIVYTIIAVGVSGGAAYLLTRRKAALS